MTDKKLPSIIMDTNKLMPAPVSVEVTYIDSSNTLKEHIDADATLMNAQLALLMQAWPQLTTITELSTLSDQIMKVADKRRQLCLRATSKQDLKDDDIDITPI